jgi:F0F1-type ATP synthase assembly protein I
MGKVVLPSTRRKVYGGVCFSLGCTVLISFIAFFFQKQIGCSLLLGGVLWFLPELYVAYRLFHRIESSPKHAVMMFYRTEMVKLFLVGLLFILVVKEFPVSILGLIVGYFIGSAVFFMKGIH